jgi:hypothetical protein
MVIDVNMDGIKATVAFLLAISEEDISGIPLGSLLNSNYTVPCLMSSVTVASLAQLDVSVESTEYVKLNGFISSDVSIALDNSWTVLHRAYRDELDALLPSVMQTVVPGIVNSLLRTYIAENTIANCLTYSSGTESEFIDFRDLFMNSTESVAVGGSGEQPYGNVASQLVGSLKTFLVSPDEETGEPGINTFLIRPFTESQSNISGTISFFAEDEKLCNGNDSNEVDTSSFEFCAYSTRFENLDSVGYPLKILEPRTSEQHILDSAAVVGVGPNQINFVTGLSLKSFFRERA